MGVSSLVLLCVSTGFNVMRRVVRCGWAWMVAKRGWQEQGHGPEHGRLFVLIYFVQKSSLSALPSSLRGRKTRLGSTHVRHIASRLYLLLWLAVVRSRDVVLAWHVPGGHDGCGLEEAACRTANGQNGGGGTYIDVHGMAWHGGNGVTEAIRPAFQRPGLQLQMAVVWEGA
jgi:hypothetical protein